ncbi:MAG: hypothetical protein GYB31_04325 [Bacteroidetes bacterium]|nr:hypothetical protein [Bacteroidota bacterium]
MKYFLFLIFLFSGLFTSSLWGQDIEQVIKEKPWDWSGSIGANTNFYHVQGIPNRSNPFFWNLSANFTGKIYGFALPFSLTVGKHEYSFNRPFLQAGFSPSWRWIKLHLGTRSMYFSPYTLAGHTFDGAGVELTPGKFRFAAMYGRLRRARDYDPELDFRFHPALYARYGYAFKIGVGSKDTYVDLSFLKAADDPNSIEVLPQDTSITPSENAVIGLSAGLGITENIRFFGEGAISIFTRNTNSIDASEFVDSEVANFFSPTLSTRVNYALKGGMDFSFSAFRLKLAYERIMPEFETMGAYFFANDRERITIAPTFRLAKSRLNINGNLGLERNNLLGNRSETTRRLIGNANLSYFSQGGFGIVFAYTNYNIDQQQAALELSDSVRVAMVTTNISLTPTYSWSDSSRLQSVSLSANYQQLNDKNPFTREFTNMNTTFITGGYNINFFESGLGINAGLNYNIIQLALFTTTRYGVSGGINQSLAEDKFSYSINATFNLSAIEGTPDGSLTSGNINLSYSPHVKHRFNLFSNILFNQSEQFDNFTEFYGGLGYVLRLK